MVLVQTVQKLGLEIKIGATKDAKWAYEMGRVSGVEASAIGCNWSFAPIVDINMNWRNPIISNRTFGSDPRSSIRNELSVHERYPGKRNRSCC